LILYLSLLNKVIIYVLNTLRFTNTTVFNVCGLYCYRMATVINYSV